MLDAVEIGLDADNAIAFFRRSPKKREVVEARAITEHALRAVVSYLLVHGDTILVVGDLRHGEDYLLTVTKRKKESA